MNNTRWVNPVNKRFIWDVRKIFQEILTKNVQTVKKRKYTQLEKREEYCSLVLEIDVWNIFVTSYAELFEISSEYLELLS